MSMNKAEHSDHREHGGKNKRLAGTILAAGIAMGGAATFGNLNVYAANEDTVDSMEPTSGEPSSVETPSDSGSSESSGSSEPAATQQETPSAAVVDSGSAVPSLEVTISETPSDQEESLAATLSAEQSGAVQNEAIGTPVVQPVANTAALSITNATEPSQVSQGIVNTNAQISIVEPVINQDGTVTTAAAITTTSTDPVTGTTTTTTTSSTETTGGSGYNELDFGIKDDAKTDTQTSTVTQPDGTSAVVTTTTNEYTAANGSTTTETITETVTPGADPTTTTVTGDGSARDAVLVDQNGAPILDAGGNAQISNVTNWTSGIITESKGATTVTTYKAIVTSEAASADESGVDASLTRYYFTALVDGKETRIFVSDQTTTLDAVPVTQTVADQDGSQTEVTTYYSVNYEGVNYTLSQNAVQVSSQTTQTVVSGTDENGSKVDVAVTDNADKLTVTKAEKDGYYNLTDKDGNTHTLQLSNVVEIPDSGKESYVLTVKDSDGNDVTLSYDSLASIPVEKGSAEGTYILQHDGKTYTLQSSEEQKVTADTSKTTTETHYYITGTENGTEKKVEVAVDNKAVTDNKFAVTANGNGTYSAAVTDKDGNEHTLTFNSAEQDGEGTTQYYFIDAGGNKVKVSSNAQLSVSKDAAGKYKVSVDGKEYSVSTETVTTQSTITGKNGDGESVTIPVPSDTEKLDVQKTDNDKYYYEYKDQKDHTGKSLRIYFDSAAKNPDGTITYSLALADGSTLTLKESDSKSFAVTKKSTEDVDHYYITYEGKEYEVPAAKVKTTEIKIAGVKDVYADDEDLSAISNLLGDYGIVALEKTGSNHMDSNFYYGTLSSYQLGGSNDIYVLSDRENGKNYYVGELDIEHWDESSKSIVASGNPSEAVLHIKLKSNQKLRHSGSEWFVDTVDSNNNVISGKTITIQNFKNVIEETDSIKDQLESKLNTIKDYAVKLSAKETAKATNQNPNGVSCLYNVNNDQKYRIDTTKVTKTGTADNDVIYVKLGLVGNNIEGFTEAEKAQIYINDDQILVLNIDKENNHAESDKQQNIPDSINLQKFKMYVNTKDELGNAKVLEFTSDPTDVSGNMIRFSQNIVFNFGNYSGKIITQGSICGLLLAPNASVTMNATSTGRVVAHSYHSGSGEWHYSGYVSPRESEVRYTYSIEADETPNVTYYVVPDTTRTIAPDKEIVYAYYVMPTSETIKTMVYSVTPKTERESTYYVIPVNETTTLYVAKVDPQYYKKTEYSKTRTERSSTRSERYVYMVSTPETPPSTPPKTPPSTPPSTPPKTPPTTPDVPTDPVTPKEPVQEVLGAVRTEAEPTSAAAERTVLGAARGHGTGDAANLILSACGAAASGVLLGIMGYLRSRKNRRRHEGADEN